MNHTDFATEASSFDLIGDIHGYAEPLAELLAKLGYRERHGVWRHGSRRAVFLGDFIDRGPHQREVIGIVRPMIENGAALSVMGNHEFNAIAYHTRHPETGLPLREWSQKNSGQHKAFTDAYEGREAEMRDVIDWFRTLPLWLDLGGFRVVHACWDRKLIERLWHALDRGQQLTDELLIAASQRGTWQHEAVETLLKGKEIPLPDGHSFPDKDGNLRHEIRVRWWDNDAGDYRSAFLGPETARTHIPDDPIKGDHLVDYRHDDPPCFLGHYWLNEEPELLAPNIACLDYSVAATGGKLIAYRWDGEQKLRREKFVAVKKDEEVLDSLP